MVSKADLSYLIKKNMFMKFLEHTTNRVSMKYSSCKKSGYKRRFVYRNRP